MLHECFRQIHTTYIHIYKCICTHIHVYVHMYVCMCICTYVLSTFHSNKLYCKWLHIHTQSCIYVCMYIFMYIFIYLHMYICKRLCHRTPSSLKRFQIIYSFLHKAALVLNKNAQTGGFSIMFQKIVELARNATQISTRSNKAENRRSFRVYLIIH